MAVFSLSRRESVEPGIYPFDPHKHLRGVAELVGSVFADDMDEEGRSMMREMQMVGWLSPLLGSLITPAFLGDFVAGFVWAEGDRVLGNVTLQRIDGSGTRWRISNVCVAPEHRGQGIARALMLSSISEIAQQSGSWAVLQVRADNPPARQLYRSLGFTDVCLDGVWRLPAAPVRLPAPLAVSPGGPATAQHAGFCPLSPRAWHARFELAQTCQTQLAHWIAPVDAACYRVGWMQWAGEALGSLTGLYRVRRWGTLADAPRRGSATSGSRLLGCVEASARATGEPHKLRLLVRPEARGHLEVALVRQGLRSLEGAPSAPVVAEQSGDHVEGVAALEMTGFRPQRVLLTMRREITPADALL